MSNEAVRAIQALRLLRAQPELRGHEFAEQIRSKVLPSAPGPLRPHAELEPVLLLLEAGLIRVYIKSEYRPGRDIPYMNVDRFKQTWAQFGLDNYIFSVSPQLAPIQRALGIYSLSEMEQRAQGDSLVVSPLFGVPRHTHLKRNLFVLLPPSTVMRPVYEMAIRPAAEGLNLTLGRAEDFFAGHASVIEIWEALYAADIVIGDCTRQHPAVFYELGIAHTLGKHTIVIAQDLEHIPVEFRQLHHVIYDNTRDGLDRLCSDLQALLLAVARAGDATSVPA